MAIPHAAPGEPIDLFSRRGPASAALVRDEHFEVFRLAMEAGKELPEHELASLSTIQCLRGRIEVRAQGRVEALATGYLMYLGSCEPRAIRAVEESLILVTMRVRRE
jgi:quercetin dioxygenase-like cupin family protein